MSDRTPDELREAIEAEKAADARLRKERMPKKTRGHVREELIQVAAVAVAIVQDIDTGSAKVGLGDLEEAVNQVKVERRKQNAKFGAQHHTIPEWLMILGEEYGEACQAAVDSYGLWLGEPA